MNVDEWMDFRLTGWLKPGTKLCKTAQQTNCGASNAEMQLELNILVE